MASYLNSKSPVDTSKFDYNRYFYSLPENERKRLFEVKQSVGLEAPTEDNVFVEFGQSFAQGAAVAGRGFGVVLNEIGMGSRVQDYFSEVLRYNQQWNEPSDCSIATNISRTIGYSIGITWYIWFCVFVVLLFKFRKKIKKMIS